MESKRIRRSCNICYLPVTSPLKCYECTFLSCRECILAWTERSRLCPQCRKYRTFDLDYADSEVESVSTTIAPAFVEIPWWINTIELNTIELNDLEMVAFQLHPPPPPTLPIDEFGQLDSDPDEDPDPDEEPDPDEDPDPDENPSNYYISTDSESTSSSSSSHTAYDT